MGLTINILSVHIDHMSTSCFYHIKLSKSRPRNRLGSYYGWQFSIEVHCLILDIPFSLNSIRVLQWKYLIKLYIWSQFGTQYHSSKPNCLKTNIWLSQTWLFEITHQTKLSLYLSGQIVSLLIRPNCLETNLSFIQTMLFWITNQIKLFGFQLSYQANWYFKLTDILILS